MACVFTAMQMSMLPRPRRSSARTAGPGQAGLPDDRSLNAFRAQGRL